MTTVPALNIIQNLDPTDTIMITHADGSTERFSASKIIPADTVASGNMKAVTSNAVANAVSNLQPANNVIAGNMKSVTSNAVAQEILPYMHWLNGSGGDSTLAGLENLITTGQSAPACFGSQYLTDGPGGSKWYNFFYIPHRNGIGGDNFLHGSLFLFNMSDDTDNMWICHKINGTFQAPLMIGGCKTLENAVTPSVTPSNLSQAIADMLNIISVETYNVGTYIVRCNYGSYFEVNMTVTVRGANPKIILVRGSTVGWDGVSARDDHLFTASKYTGEDWIIKIY